MNIYPTRTAVHLAIGGVVTLAVGIAVREPNIVAWGGAVLVGVTFARAVTLLSVIRIRNAGFEMLWPDAKRARRVMRGETIELHAEVRNRDTLAARYDKLRVIASPALECTIEPPAGEVKATGSVSLTLKVRARRTGYHGIHGLALEVRGAPGLFEVPLTFANAFGLEVIPRAAAQSLATPSGGRSRTVSATGRAANRRGDGSELRELRELVPGDSFRRIAWKASARRGKLMARELEREERDVVMLVLDASVELWAGAIGDAPLDHAIDAVATLADAHLSQGDQVGLVIVATRELARVPVDGGRGQLAAITVALCDRTGVLDADRSGWDESDIAVQVAEHLRPVDPRGLRDLRRGRYDRLAERATAAESEAPFGPRSPAGTSKTDADLRRYAARFGLYGPPRLEPERDRTVATLVSTLLGLATATKPRPTVVHVIAPAPSIGHDAAAIRGAARTLRKKGVAVRWSSPPLGVGVAASTRKPAQGGTLATPAPNDEPESSPELVAALAATAQHRARIASRKGDALLRGMGIKVSRPLPRPAKVQREDAAPPPSEANS